METRNRNRNRKDYLLNFQRFCDSGNIPVQLVKWRYIAFFRTYLVTILMALLCFFWVNAFVLLYYAFKHFSCKINQFMHFLPLRICQGLQVYLNFENLLIIVQKKWNWKTVKMYMQWNNINAMYFRNYIIPPYYASF